MIQHAPIFLFRHFLDKPLGIKLLTFFLLTVASTFLIDASASGNQVQAFGSCNHPSSTSRHYGQVHVRTTWRNNATGATGTATDGSITVRLRIRNQDGSTTYNRTRSPNSAGVSSFCRLLCGYHSGPANNDYLYSYRASASGTPGGLPSGGSWSAARTGTLRNNQITRVTLQYRFTPRTWNYTPSTHLQDNFVRHEEGITVTGRVRNTGNGRGAGYETHIQRRVGSGPWEHQRSITGESGLNAGSTRNRNSHWWSPPKELPNWTRVCFRTRVMPYRGYSEPSISVTSSGWRTSREACLRVYTPPPSFRVSADCEQIRINNLNMYGRSATQVRVTVGGTVAYSGRSLPPNLTVAYPRAEQVSTNRMVRVTITNDIANGSSSTRSARVGACYEGSCRIQDFRTNNPNDEVFVTDGYSTRASSSNSGGLPWNSRYNVRAAFTVNHGSTPGPSRLVLARGGSIGRTYTGFRAGQTLSQHTVVKRLQYQNVNGGWVTFRTCSRSFDPFVRFELSPLITSEALLPNLENPNTYRLGSRVDVSTSPTVPNYPIINGPTATRNMTASGGASVSPSSHGPSTGFPTTYNDNSSVNGFELGAQFCGNISLSYTTGWVNRHGNIPRWTQSGSGSAGSDCLRVEDRPYVSVFGADMIAAGDFGVENCDQGTTDATTGVISTFFDLGELRGSGSQFAALAVNTISQFSSAKMRAPTTETSFANAPGSGSYGGNYPGSHCITDYWSQMPDDIETRNITSALNQSNGKYLIEGNATTSLGQTTLSRGNNLVVYVDGDLHLRRNIIYQEGWASVDDIPSMFLVVRGNIYIDPRVEQLDGVYVAQPGSDGAGGSIYTCATSIGSVVSAGNLVSDCSQHLEVNGAFVARDITFNRYGGSSLRYGSQSEFVYGSGRTCASSGVVTERPVCAAEIINFSPELYLVNPNLPAERGPGQGVYDSITNLTPIF